MCYLSGNSDCFYVMRIDNTIIYLQQITKKSIIFNDSNTLTITLRNPANIITDMRFYRKNKDINSNYFIFLYLYEQNVRCSYLFDVYVKVYT